MHHTTGTYALLALPLALLLLIIPISLNYRYFKTLPIPRHTMQTLTAFHAFTTEGLQLLIAISSFAAVVQVYNTMSDRAAGRLLLMLAEEWGRGYYDFAVAVILLLLPGLVLAKLYFLLVSLVDVLEGRILLGSWRHPYAGKSFVITRWAIVSLVMRIKVCFVGIYRAQQTERLAVQTAVLGKKRKILLSRLAVRRSMESCIKRLRQRYGNLRYLDLDSRSKRYGKRGMRRTRTQVWYGANARVKSACAIPSTGGANNREPGVEVYLPTPPASEARARASSFSTLPQLPSLLASARDVTSANESIDQEADMPTARHSKHQESTSSQADIIGRG